MTADRIKVSQLIAPAFIPVHLDLKHGGHAEYWLKGGRGSTKSSFIATEIILGLLQDPDACAIVYRKVAATLRESVYEELSKVIHRMDLAPWFQFRISPLEIRYKPTGQRILFRGADDPAKSKSIALAKGYFRYLWFEELAEFSGMEDVRTIQASVIRGMGQRRGDDSHCGPHDARKHLSGRAARMAGRRFHLTGRSPQGVQRARLPPHVSRRGHRHRRPGV